MYRFHVKRPKYKAVSGTKSIVFKQEYSLTDDHANYSNIYNNLAILLLN